jgi:aspartyl protease family protein
VVEHSLGKGEVDSSILSGSTTDRVSSGVSEDPGTGEVTESEAAPTVFVYPLPLLPLNRQVASLFPFLFPAGTAMERPRNNQFLEPERGSGMVGWAVKQLAMWLVGGFIVYSVVANHQLFGGSSAPDAPPSGAVASTPDVSAAAEKKLTPLGQSVMTTNSLTLRARSNGHVYLNATVNNVPIQFVIDTGATWVSLTRQDAIRAGVAGNLNYTVPMYTANGVAKAARVTLGGVRVGQLEVDDVEAMVLPEETGISLLGQSFLKRLQGYEMRGDVLTLTWQ